MRILQISNFEASMLDCFFIYFLNIDQFLTHFILAFKKFESEEIALW